MQPWKTILLIIPPGLVLGMIGGHLARPEMQVRAGDVSPAMYETRAQRYGSSTAYTAQTNGPMDYSGGYSYPPDWAAGGTTARVPPSDDRAWTYADVPLPTVTQLDARQAALLADPDVQFAVPSPADSNEQMVPAAPTQASEQGPHPETVDIASAAPFPASAEPSTPDGQLPAIW